MTKRNFTTRVVPFVVTMFWCGCLMAQGMFGNGPELINTGEDELGEHPTTSLDEEGEASGPELLVFDLYFSEDVSFRSGDEAEFYEAFQETLDEEGGYAILSELDRSRRFRSEALLVGGDIEPEQAFEFAEAIGVEYYLLPRVGAADSSHYTISVIFGAVADGEAGLQQFDETTSRRVDYVERAIRSLVAEALASPLGE